MDMFASSIAFRFSREQTRPASAGSGGPSLGTQSEAGEDGPRRRNTVRLLRPAAMIWINASVASQRNPEAVKGAAAGGDHKVSVAERHVDASGF
jgi:hypothetical protein